MEVSTFPLLIEFICIIGNESLHEISNDNGVRVVNVATSKNLVKSTMFPHRNIHKYTWTSPDGKPHTQIDHFLVDRRRVYLMFDLSGQQIVIVTTMWWWRKLRRD
jgi:hypothetical protein